MPPTKDQVIVATNALRSDAAVWQAQSTELAAIGPRVQDLRLSRIEAGVFQLVVGPYDTLADQLTDRCAEGTDRLSEVGRTLRAVADTYDAEEARNEHALRNLY